MSMGGASFVVPHDRAAALAEALRRDYRLFGPVRRSGASRFADQDILSYAEVETLDALDLSAPTFFSPKEILFPVRETMFRVGGDSLAAAPADEKPVLVFLRSCDIHAVDVMDLHFLSGQHPDVYYQRRRSRIRIVYLECPCSFAHCHCRSLGTAAPAHYDAFFRKTANGQEWIVADPALGALFAGMEGPVAPPCSVPDDQDMTEIPDRVDTSLFGHDLWKEYSRRCIACGRCNTSCPTCTCFSVWDVKTDAGVERQRIWSACHVKKFSLLAGNHDFRAKNGERMRYKVLHKIQDFRDRTGKQMCTGCGRCDLVCPEYISMFRSIGKLNAIVAADGGKTA